MVNRSFTRSVEADEFETVGYIGVDAGIIMLIDPCYIVPAENWSEFCDESFEKEEVNRGTYKEFTAEMDVGGIVVTTAHGDGSYPVSVRRNASGRIVEVRVLFDWDPNPDEGMEEFDRYLENDTNEDMGDDW